MNKFSTIDNVHPRGRHRAFMLMDMLTGMLVLGVLAGVFAVASNRAAGASSRLAQSRRATNIAESVLTSIQSGQLPEIESGVQVVVKAIPSATASKSDCKWISVQVELAPNVHAELFGIVPANAALPSATPEATR